MQIPWLHELILGEASDQKIVQAVQEMFTRSPWKSIRQSSTIRTVLKKGLKGHAWKPHSCQSLSVADYLRFAWSLQRTCWLDMKTGQISLKKYSLEWWVVTTATTGEDPLVISESMQNRPKVTLWRGMISYRIVGPSILRDTMNAERYLTMLQMKSGPLSVLERMLKIWFSRRRCPSTLCYCRSWMAENHFSGRWIGGRGPHEWPARSLNTLWLFSFRVVKGASLPYQTKDEEPERRIQEVIPSITQELKWNLLTRFLGGLEGWQRNLPLSNFI